MTWVQQDEYNAIRASWRGGKGGKRVDYGSARENLERCHHNMQEAARTLADLRALYNRLPPGDIRLTGGTRTVVGADGSSISEEVPSLRELIAKARAERDHWREYVSHYQPLAAAEPAPRRPTDPLPDDRRLPREREIGDDDVEDERREFIR